MASPTSEELKLLKKFRNIIEDIHLKEDMDSDMELLRWLRARDYNLLQAEAMLRKHMQWRIDRNYDKMDSWEECPKFEGLLPQKVLGVDDDNCPILLLLMGRWNGRKVIQEGAREDCINPQWKLYKGLKERMKFKKTRDGTPVTQVSIIIDLSNLSMRQACIPVCGALSEFARDFEANFPEFLKIMIIINAPWFFSIFFKVIRPFCSPKTLEKIHILGSNREEWVPLIRNSFPNLPWPIVYEDKLTKHIV
ncbi:unnamed protein product [Allacma fusca]|uniref:CRAL-TRIO domain-containing protein n=1 Tax=Allacma fusca TaxID=39272 RepID=A0A8J2KAT3_9HEXA|nr:unnamed protein product [Allacma fusca]